MGGTRRRQQEPRRRFLPTSAISYSFLLKGRKRKRARTALSCEDGRDCRRSACGGGAARNRCVREELRRRRVPALLPGRRKPAARQASTELPAASFLLVPAVSLAASSLPEKLNSPGSTARKEGRICHKEYITLLPSGWILHFNFFFPQSLFCV